MIFGEIVHKEHYSEVFPLLVEIMEQAFEDVASGMQGDAHIRISENNEEVKLDTFTSMRFQLKSERSGGLLLEKVVSVVSERYEFCLYNEPEREGYED